MTRSKLAHAHLALIVAGALVLAQEARAQGAFGTPKRGFDPPTLLRAGVHVVDDQTLRALVHGPQGRSTLAFGSITPQLRRVSRGDVLVGGASERAPRGLLRRVTRVSRREDGLVVETEPATLEDLFWRARLRERIELRAQDVSVAAARVEGVRVPEARAEAWSPGRIEVELLHVVLYDLDENPATTGDQVTATGVLGVEPSFDVDLDIAWGRIERFQFTNANDLSASLELEGRVTIADLDHQVTVASLRFAPVTVFVGPVPLVLTPILDVQVGVSGAVTAGIRTSITVETTASAGVLYLDGRWTASADLPDGLEDFELQWRPPELTAEAAARVHAGPELTVLLYDLGGPFASVHGYSLVRAEVLPDREWHLDVGLRGSAGLVVVAPGTGGKTRYGLEVFDRSWRVASGSF